jgi:hypothetical protein
MPGGKESEVSRRRLAESEMSEEDRKSVSVLRDLSESVRFEKAGENINIYFSEDSRGQEKPSRQITREELFKAVDYYCEHRVSESSVNKAMKDADRKVDVYSPYTSNQDNVILLSIKNYMVPQILELAYLFARAELKKNNS